MKKIESIKIIPVESLPEQVELVGQPRVLPISAEEVNKLRIIRDLETMLNSTATIDDSNAKHL